MDPSLRPTRLVPAAEGIAWVQPLHLPSRGSPGSGRPWEPCKGEHSPRQDRHPLLCLAAPLSHCAMPHCRAVWSCWCSHRSPQAGKGQSTPQTHQPSPFSRKISGKGMLLLQSAYCWAQLSGGTCGETKRELHGAPDSRKVQPHRCVQDPSPLCRIRPGHSARVAHWGFARPVLQV